MTHFCCHKPKIMAHFHSSHSVAHILFVVRIFLLIKYWNWTGTVNHNGGYLNLIVVLWFKLHTKHMLTTTTDGTILLELTVSKVSEHSMPFQLKIHRRVITPRGVKHCRLLKILNLILTFFGSWHFTCA